SGGGESLELVRNAPASRNHEPHSLPVKASFKHADAHKRKTTPVGLANVRPRRRTPELAWPRRRRGSSPAAHDYCHRVGALPRPARFVSEQLAGTRARIA